MDDNSNFLTNFIKISETETLLFIISLIAILMILIIVWRIKKKWILVLLTGVFLGIINAIIFSALNNFAGINTSNTNVNSQVWQKEVAYWSDLISQVFFNSVSIILPFVLFSSIIVSILKYSNNSAKKSLRTGFLRLFLLYMLGIIVTVVISLLFIPLDFKALFNVKIDNLNNVANIIPFGERLVSFIPKSISDFFNISNASAVSGIETSSSGSVSGIISAVIVGLVFGIVLISLKKNAYHKNKKDNQKKIYETIEKGIYGFNSIMNGILNIVVKYIPFAIVGFVTSSLFKEGVNQLFSGVIFIGFMFLILFMIVFLLTGMNLFFTQGKNKFTILKNIAPPLITGFFTQSSQASLPLTRKALLKELKINPIIADAIPTFAVSGLSIACTGAFPLLAAIVIKKQLGDVDVIFYIQAIIIVTILSFGMAGVPGDAAVASTNAIKSLFANQLSLSYLGIILSTDLFSEMARTSTNIYGAITAAIWTDYTYKKIKK